MHVGVGLLVVPRGPDDLFERPGFPAIPLGVVAAERVPEDPASTVVEQMPARDQINSRVRRTEPTGVHNTDQTPVSDEQVPRDQTTVGYLIRPVS